MDACYEAALLGSAASGDIAAFEGALARATSVLSKEPDLKTACALAARGGHVAVIDAILSRAHDVAPLVSRSLRIAAATGHAALVEHLVSVWDAEAGEDDSIALAIAAEHGHLAIVERLLADEDVSPAGSDGAALWTAAGNGHLTVMERMLADPRADPSASRNAAIRKASCNGHAHVVARLLADDRVSPGAAHEEALLAAVAYGTHSLVAQLLADPRVDPCRLLELEGVGGRDCDLRFAPAVTRFEVLRQPSVLRNFVVPAHIEAAGREAPYRGIHEDGPAPFCWTLTRGDARAMAGAAWRRRRHAVLAWTQAGL